MALCRLAISYDGDRAFIEEHEGDSRVESCEVKDLLREPERDLDTAYRRRVWRERARNKSEE